MKNYNKLPFKERKRHAQYALKQEESLIKREIKQLENMKRAAEREESYAESDKEREEREAFERLKEIAEAGK